VTAGGSFNPSKITVPAGTEVEFENLDHEPHKIVSDYPFTTEIPTEFFFKFIFEKAGTYSIWDEASPLVKGAIIVT
jgi:plastocyanin